MNDTQIKFLLSLGISKDKYPPTFFSTIQDINAMVTNVELAYCAVDSLCDGQPGTFCIKDVVGTDHQRYAGKTWLDAFSDLDRGTDIIKLYEDNPNYWEEIKSLDNADIGLLKYRDKYYIFSKAGGGNNRLITMKIKYLALIYQAGNDPDEIERINNQFTFSANIRELPRDNTIPFIVVAMSEDLSGLRVRQSGGRFTVTQKGNKSELFNGDSEQLINYFKELFCTKTYGDYVVKKRLGELNRGCSMSPKKYREVLEKLLPETFGKLGER